MRGERMGKEVVGGSTIRPHKQRGNSGRGKKGKLLTKQ